MPMLVLLSCVPPNSVPRPPPPKHALPSSVPPPPLPKHALPRRGLPRYATPPWCLRRYSPFSLRAVVRSPRTSG